MGPALILDLENFPFARERILYPGKLPLDGTKWTPAIRLIVQEASWYFQEKLNSIDARVERVDPELRVMIELVVTPKTIKGLTLKDLEKNQKRKTCIDGSS